MIGNEKRVQEQLKEIGLDENYKIKIVNSTDKEKRDIYKKIVRKITKKRFIRERCR